MSNRFLNIGQQLVASPSPTSNDTTPTQKRDNYKSENQQVHSPNSKKMNRVPLHDYNSFTNASNEANLRQMATRSQEPPALYYPYYPSAQNQPAKAGYYSPNGALPRIDHISPYYVPLKPSKDYWHQSIQNIENQGQENVHKYRSQSTRNLHILSKSSLGTNSTPNAIIQPLRSHNQDPHKNIEGVNQHFFRYSDHYSRQTQPRHPPHLVRQSTFNHSPSGGANQHPAMNAGYPNSHYANEIRAYYGSPQMDRYSYGQRKVPMPHELYGHNIQFRRNEGSDFDPQDLFRLASKPQRPRDQAPVYLHPERVNRPQQAHSLANLDSNPNRQEHQYRRSNTLTETDNPGEIIKKTRRNKASIEIFSEEENEDSIMKDDSSDSELSLSISPANRLRRVSNDPENHDNDQYKRRKTVNPHKKSASMTILADGSEKGGPKTKRSILTKNTRKKTKTMGGKAMDARTRLKTYLWVVVYPALFFNHTHVRAHKRKATIRHSIINSYGTFTGEVQRFFADELKLQLESIYNEKKSMVIVEGIEKGFFGKKSLSQKETDNRIYNLIMPKLRKLLNVLIEKAKGAEFPESLIKFIASITENQSVPPDRFLFEFEVRRLNFTHLGTLKGMTSLHSKMIIGMFLVIRVIVYQFLVQPWNELKHLDYKIPADETAKRNLKTIASVLYHATMDLFRGKVPVAVNNQVFLSVDMKVKGRVSPLKTPELMNEKVKVSEEDVMSGLFTKKELTNLFGQKMQDINDLKGLIYEFLDHIYNKTHQIHSQIVRKKAHRDRKDSNA